MTEERLVRLAAYRRTWKLIHLWRCPDGIEMGLICRPDVPRVDVIMRTCECFVERSLNVTFRSQEEAFAVLDFMADTLMFAAVDAYERHEVARKSEVVLGMALERARRDFEEGMKSAACGGKGGGD